MALDYDFEEAYANDFVETNNLIFDISKMSREEKMMCLNVAKARVAQQIKDVESGNKRAMNSFGKLGSKDTRSIELREHQAFMGTLGELIASKYAKCAWTKEMKQYDGNKKPDLQAVFKGKSIKCEARASGSWTSIPYRPHQDKYRSDSLLIGITNMPKGPECKVGHILFSDATELVAKHPEWIGASNKTSGNPYYTIPLEYFSQDFSYFGE